MDFKEKNIYELPSWISGLVNLRTVNLRNSKIKLDDLKKLSNLKNLEIVDISKNNFFPSNNRALSKILENWQHLNEINLSYTGGNQNDYSYISNLKYLKKIDLSGNNISSIDTLSMTKLERLTHINLSNNKITGDLSPSFLPKNSLINLNISNNNISRFIFSGNIPNLTSLNLSGNKNILLDDQYGGIFVLKKLKNIVFEKTAKIPLGLLSKSDKWKNKNKISYLPKMKVIPAGEYIMGCSKDSSKHCTKDEMPAHKVKLKSFEIGIYEVSNFEYNLCVKDKKCEAKSGEDNRPVQNTSWDDAIDYIIWLNSNTGKEYRLPSEAEWEYVAKSSGNNLFSFGGKIGLNNANCANCNSRWDNKSTSPVGSFSPNKYGIYDMHGNVWEWVMDCPHAYLPIDDHGSPWVENEGGIECSKKRIVRGGSYKTNSETLISWNRAYANKNQNIWDCPDYFSNSSFNWDSDYGDPCYHTYHGSIGFRVARSLPLANIEH